MSTPIFVAAMAGNVAWFGAAFRYFGFQHNAAAKVLVPRPARQSPLFPTVAAGVRFLGGMNGALAALAGISIAAATASDTFFGQDAERQLLLATCALAHLSQFGFNLPVLRANRRTGDAPWPVTSGPMRTIFTVDAALTVVNVVAIALIAAA